MKELGHLAQVPDEQAGKILAVARRLMEVLAFAIAALVAIACYWATLHWHELAVVAMAFAAACLWCLGFVRSRRRAGTAAWRASRGRGEGA